MKQKNNKKTRQRYTKDNQLPQPYQPNLATTIKLHTNNTKWLIKQNKTLTLHKETTSNKLNTLPPNSTIQYT